MPDHIDLDAVRDALRRIDGVDEVHELHVWSISSGIDSLSCHLVRRGADSDSTVLREVRKLLVNGFGIRHVTIQTEESPCSVDVHG